MNKNDTKWFEKVTTQPQINVTQPQGAVSQGGRSCDIGLSDGTNRAANAIRRLQDKADKILSAPNQATRQEDAFLATQWAKELCNAVRYSQEHDSVPDGSP